MKIPKEKELREELNDFCEKANSLLPEDIRVSVYEQKNLHTMNIGVLGVRTSDFMGAETPISAHGKSVKYIPDIEVPLYGTPVEFCATQRGLHDPQTTALGWSLGRFASGLPEEFHPLMISTLKNTDGSLVHGGHALKWRTIGGEWVE